MELPIAPGKRKPRKSRDQKRRERLLNGWNPQIVVRLEDFPRIEPRPADTEKSPASEANHQAWWFAKWNREDSQCCVCLQRMRPRNTVELPCPVPKKHRLCTTCHTGLLARNRRPLCPICRCPI